MSIQKSNFNFDLKILSIQKEGRYFISEMIQRTNSNLKSQLFFFHFRSRNNHFVGIVTPRHLPEYKLSKK